MDNAMQAAIIILFPLFIIHYFSLSLQRIIKKVVSDCVSEQNKRVSILW